MRKIGILSFGEKHGGGVFQYTQSMIDALRNDSSNKYIIFCNFDDDRFDLYNLEVRKLTKSHNSPVNRAFRFLSLFFKIYIPFTLNSDEKKIFNDVDLFLSTSISPYPHYFLNKPFIFTLHDMQERYYPKFFTLRELITRRIVNNALACKAKTIICESNHVKKDIFKFTGAKEENIVVIQSPPPLNFLSFKFDENNSTHVINKYKLPKKYLFYPAQCWFHKNHIKLVEAFEIVCRQVGDVYLILTGSQQNNYFNLQQRVAQLGLKDKVIHLGYIDYEDLPYLYKMSQMLIMPTLFESVSIPIYEAFALKIPVCSSNVVSLPEQVGNAGLIFDPFSPEDMAEKMLIYLNDKKLATEKAQLGFDKVFNFNHDEYRKKLLQVLSKEPQSFAVTF